MLMTMCNGKTILIHYITYFFCYVFYQKKSLYAFDIMRNETDFAIIVNFLHYSVDSL